MFAKFVAKYLSYGVGRMLRETGLALDAHGSNLSRDIAYLQPLSRHRKIMPLWGSTPAIYDSALIADNATLVGEVVIGDKTKIGYGVVAKADEHAIRIGHQCVVGDNTIIQCCVNRLPSGVPHSVNIGNNVSIGDGCVLSSCIIDDNATIGQRCLILDGSQIERGSVLLPNSVVPPGRVILANQVWGGSPAQFVRDLQHQKDTQKLEQN